MKDIKIISGKDTTADKKNDTLKPKINIVKPKVKEEPSLKNMAYLPSEDIYIDKYEVTVGDYSNFIKIK